MKKISQIFIALTFLVALSTNIFATEQLPETTAIPTEESLAEIPVASFPIPIVPSPAPISIDAPKAIVEGEMTTVIINYNGQDFPNMGFEKMGTSYVYVQDFFQIFDGPSVILEDDGSVVVGFPKGNLAFRPNSQNATIYGIDVPLSETTYLVDGKAVVPARDIAKIMNLDITWNGETKTVSLKTMEYIDTMKAQYPYYIYVDKSDFLMTIYSIDENGDYTQIVSTMETSLGKTDKQTPEGVFTIGTKEEWHKWKSGVYTKYSTMYAPGFYIHSPLYEEEDDNTLIQSSVDKLGTRDTAGCLQISTENAKWIYDNCPEGTIVEIVK